MKNKWILLNDTRGKHNRFPIIWNDNNPNILNIASVGKLVERIDIRENKWHSYKPHNKRFDKLFERRFYNDDYRDYMMHDY